MKGVVTVKITFLGATHEVTGSYTLLEWMEGRYLIIDYGMTQWDDDYVNEPLPVPAEKIEYVLLTHAHIDHSGNLPLLYRNGFRGTIYCTAETMNLCTIMLADSAHIQESEALSQNKKNQRAGRPEVEPLYTAEDAAATMKLFQPCHYDKIYQIDEGLSIRFTDIGHLLGSASIECFLREGNEERTMVFSGDVGNINQPILNDPKPVRAADYLMIEATYGGRLHNIQEDPVPKLVDILSRTFKRGGSVIIPSFAVGRTQELLYFFREIKKNGLIPEYPDFPVYLDSPMANEATAVFLQCDTSCLDDETKKIMLEGDNPIWFDGLQTTTDSNESKALNSNTLPKVIIASGGMCEGGRIRHHLKHNLWNAANTILFVGYQSAGTLGRIIYDGAKEVKIYGDTIEVKAEVELLNGVSGHADQAGLLNWLDMFDRKPSYVFINHGDHDSCTALEEKIKTEKGLSCLAPYSGSSFDLIRGEWIKLTAPVFQSGKKEGTQNRIVKRAKKELNAYQEAVTAAEELLERIRNMKGHANHELRQLTQKIQMIK